MDINLQIENFLNHSTKKPPAYEKFEKSLNKWGYFPVTGQAFSIIRAGYGLTKIIASIYLIAKRILNDKLIACDCAFPSLNTLFQIDDYKIAAKDGFLHIGRAFIEFIPVIGGAITFRWDGRHKTL